MTSWSNLQISGLRGKLTQNASLRQLSWLRVGGPADWLFEPADEADLQTFLASIPSDMPVTCLGAGSNTLIRDGGIEGAVIRLTGTFATISQADDIILAGAGTPDGEVARFAAKAGRAGLSFLIGIPGTIGGGLRMNAGCYGTEFKDVLVTARAISRTGDVIEANADEMGMAYRHSDAPSDWIFTSAAFRTTEGDPDKLRAEMKEMIAQRGEAQPVGARTGGSTFANPDGKKAWQVIDAAGCRGLTVGDAHMSEKHCNFLINNGSASASDIETLGETVRARVAESSGISLRWEIRRVGRHPQNGDNL